MSRISDRCASGQLDGIAAATSTGGMVNQSEGRVGDTPIIGAGTYARDGVVAVSCTGEGEAFIKGVVAHDIAARMRYLGYPCYSRYFCASGNGFFLEAILRHGGKHPDVHEVRCHCWGDGVCEYEMTWR